MHRAIYMKSAWVQRGDNIEHPWNWIPFAYMCYFRNLYKPQDMMVSHICEKYQLCRIVFNKSTPNCPAAGVISVHGNVIIWEIQDIVFGQSRMLIGPWLEPNMHKLRECFPRLFSSGSCLFPFLKGFFHMSSLPQPVLVWPVLLHWLTLQASGALMTSMHRLPEHAHSRCW